MIHLTRLNKHPVVVNSELIKFVENTPDTVVTLVSGEKIVVLETVEQILQKIFEFRHRLMVWQDDPGSAEVVDPTPAEDKQVTEG